MLNKIAVTGEGITDMGKCLKGNACTGEDLDIGSISLLLLKLITHHLPERNADFIDVTKPTQHLTLLYHGHLGEISIKRKLIRPNKMVQKGFAEHAQRAAALAHYALSNQHKMAAYFHDTDGTRSDSPQRREHLKEAIEYGFRAAGLNECGLTLLPKPKSEVWFICAVKEDAYQHCHQLEDSLSGNDRSPKHAPKKVLGKYLKNADYNSQDLNSLIEKIDVTRIDMPSFNELREQVKTAITTLCGECRD